MADEIYTFRTVRIVNLPSDPAVNIIADQEEDVLTFEAGANISLTVVEDRVTISASSPIGFSGSQGFTGSRGFQGSIGDRGYTGSQGIRGFDGSRGFTGSIGFTGSQGIQGNVGPQGVIGYTGSKGERSVVPGYTGSEGTRGPTGPQGNIGYTGSQGVIGFTGSRGDIGFTGSVGATGFRGSQGEIGFSGSQGFTGSIGYSGSRGRTGYSGSRGFTGSRGIQGIQGTPGVRGYTGSQGSTGPLGQTGYSGSRGFVGSTGYTGSRGPIGPQGQTGIGFTGSQGVRGFTGSQGEPAEAFRTFRTPNPDGTTSLIIADQPEDVITFVAAKGITIDFNEATDTITFGGTGEGGSGNANVIPDLTVINNDPGKDSFLEYTASTGVLAYTPYDISDLATDASVTQALQDATDYANTIVDAEAQIRADADQNLQNYINTEIARLESDLGSNVIIINDTIDQANVYLQGLIEAEANLRANADSDLQAQIDALTVNAGNILIDLDANVTILQQQIQEVEANSITRDETLQDNIDVVADGLAQEILDRIAGDQAVQDNLDANITLVNGRIDIVEQDLSDETNARIAGDLALQNQIDTNENNLANVTNDLAQERLDRIAGDNNLQNQIYDVNGNIQLVNNRVDQEILDRIAGDEAIEANLSLSVGLLNDQIEVIRDDLSEEANIRANADQALSDRIDIEDGRNDTQDGEIDDLEARVAELENRVEFSIDYEANLTDLGNPNTQVPQNGEFIPMDGVANAGVATFNLTGANAYGGGEQCLGPGVAFVNEPGVTGTGFDADVTYNEDFTSITSVTITNPGSGYSPGDLIRLQPLGVCFTPIGYAYVEVATLTTNVVTNQWNQVRALYINAVDDEGTFHFLDGIKEGDDLVFQHRTQPSFCRMEVTANVTLTTQAALTGTANIEVTPVAFNGDILPGNGSIESDYIVQFFPSVAGDVPTYDYVDTQDNRRVLKTGDEMTGALHMKGGDVIAYGNTGSRIKAIEGADVDIADDGSLVISGTGSVTTNKISNRAGSSINFDFGGSNRFQIASSGSYFLNTPARYTYQSAAGVGNDTFDLIHKGYLDTRINNLDLANTYVAKSGDTMFGELVFDDNIVDAIKLAPVDGSQVNINYFNGTSSSVTLIDLHLRGNTENNRYRILGGSSAADAIVTYTASGNVYYNTDVSLTGNRITDLRDPDQDSDAANKGYVDGAITQSQEDMQSVYVAKDGDTMTGRLDIEAGGLRVDNGGDITVTGGGDIVVRDGGNIIAQWIDSPTGDLHLQSNGRDRFKIRDFITNSYNPIRYNLGAVGNMTDDYDLVYKGYVDDGFIKRNDGTSITDLTTLSLDGAVFRIRGNDTGRSFEIADGDGNTLFYTIDKDVRIANNQANNDNSVLNRVQNDERYGLKGDFVEKSGGTMTGKLTTEALEVTGDFDVNNSDNSINFIANKYGLLKHKNTSRFQLGNDKVIVEGSLKVQDGVDSNTGLPVDGQIDMNNRKIVNLLNPEDAQDAATKNYVDEKVAEGGGGTPEGAVMLTGNNLTETNWSIKNAANSKTFLQNTGNQIGIYNVKAPTSDHHAMPRSYADGRYLQKNTAQTLSSTTTIKSSSNYKFYIQNALNNSNNFFNVLSYSGSELLGVDGDGMVRVPRTPSADDHVANKKYVDDKVANADSGGVIDYGSSSPPSTKDRGTLLMTSTNNLYIYV